MEFFCPSQSLLSPHLLHCHIIIISIFLCCKKSSQNIGEIFYFMLGTFIRCTWDYITYNANCNVQKIPPLLAVFLIARSVFFFCVMEKRKKSYDRKGKNNAHKICMFSEELDENSLFCFFRVFLFLISYGVLQKKELHTYGLIAHIRGIYMNKRNKRKTSGASGANIRLIALFFVDCRRMSFIICIDYRIWYNYCN